MRAILHQRHNMLVLLFFWKKWKKTRMQSLFFLKKMLFNAKKNHIPIPPMKLAPANLTSTSPGADFRGGERANLTSTAGGGATWQGQIHGGLCITHTQTSPAAPRCARRSVSLAVTREDSGPSMTCNSTSISRCFLSTTQKKWRSSQKSRVRKWTNFL